jgi:hypothetical protein
MVMLLVDSVGQQLFLGGDTPLGASIEERSFVATLLWMTAKDSSRAEA